MRTSPTSPQAANELRQILRDAGVSLEVLDPIQKQDLDRLAERIGAKEEPRPKFDEADLRTLRHGIELAAGAHSAARDLVQANDVIDRLSRLIQAAEHVRHALTATEGLVEDQDLAVAMLLGEELPKEPGLEDVTGLFPHMDAVAKDLGRVIASTERARERLSESLGKTGAPSKHALDPFCLACLKCLERHQVSTSFGNSPNPERLPPAIEMVLTLQHFLPAALMSDSPETWAKRLRNVRRRHRRPR